MDLEREPVSATWSLGTLIWLPLATLMVAACLAGIPAVLRWGGRNEIDRGPSIFAAALSAVAAFLILIGTAFGMWPFKAEYHQWRETTGKVRAVSSRIIPAGERSMQQRFVVEYTDGRQRACDDTRCTLVRPGDELTLMCKRAYQWGASPGWDCNWGERRERAA